MRKGAVLVASATKDRTILFEQDKVYSNDSLISHVPGPKIIKNMDKLRRRFITDDVHDIFKSESRRKQISHDRRKSMTPPVPYKHYLVLANAILRHCEKYGPKNDDDFNCEETAEIDGNIFRLSSSLTTIVEQMDLYNLQNIRGICNNIVWIETSY